MRPDIPPDLLGVVDAVGLYQQIHEALVLAPAREVIRNVGAREFVEHLAAIGFEAGVHAQPERRIGGERQNVRQEVARRVHQVDGRLAVLDADVHVQSEDQIRARDNLHVFHDVQVALVGINLLLAPVCERMRPAGRQAQPARLGESYHVAPQPDQLVSRLFDVVTDARAHLDHRLVHFGLNGFLQDRLALGDDLHVDMRPQIAGFRIYGLVFFFDTDCEARSSWHHPAAPAPLDSGFKKLSQRNSCLLRGPAWACSMARSATASTIHSKFSGPTEW